MSCCALANGRCSIAKTLLTVTNFFFVLMGGVLLGLSLYVRLNSEWSSLFDTPEYGYSIVYFLMGLGVSVLFLSVIGLRAACKESKCLLWVYLVIILGVLVAQIFVATAIFNFNSVVADSSLATTTRLEWSSLETKVMDRLETTVEGIFTNGQCSHVNAFDPLASFAITCTTPNTGWFETFVNDKCARTNGDVPPDIQDCLHQAEQRATTDEEGVTDAQLAWCYCQDAVTNELHVYTKPLTAAAIAIAGVELLLFLAACYMACCYDKLQAEEEKRQKEQQQGYQAHSRNGNMQPHVGQKGINMV